MSLGTSINKDMNGFLLAYIAFKIPNINLRKLLKIIYLIDEHFMKMRGFPLTWFDFYAWAKGPVAPEVYEIKNGAFSEFVISHISNDNKTIVRPALDESKIDDGINQAFCLSEIKEINSLIDAYRNLTVDELTEITHINDSLWSKIVIENHIVFDENNTRTDIRIDLKRLFHDNDYRISKYDDILWNMELQAKLLSTQNPKHKIRLSVVTPTEREKYRISVYSTVIP